MDHLMSMPNATERNSYVATEICGTHFIADAMTIVSNRGTGTMGFIMASATASATNHTMTMIEITPTVTMYAPETQILNVVVAKWTHASGIAHE